MSPVYRNHDIRSLNSGTIYLPPNATIGNMAIPDLCALDTVQLYDLTTKYRFNGKTFVYAHGVVLGSGGEHANAELSITRGCSSHSTIAVSSATAIGTHAAGVSQITVEKASIVKDEWKYGHIFIGQEAAALRMNRGIIGNTATDGDGLVTVDLDIPLSVGTTHDTTGIRLYKSQYAQVEGARVTTDYEYASIVGVPMVYLASGGLNGQWLWLQTWGPVWLSTKAAGIAGDTASERMLVFDGQGQLANIVDELHTGTLGRQMAGFLLAKTKDAWASVEAYADPFIMLQIDP